MKAILLTLLTITHINLSAQTGISIGGNGSIFGRGYEVDNKVKTNVTAGIFTDFKLSKAIKMQVELNYMNKGGLINHDNPPATDRFRLNIRYAELPLVLRIGSGHFKIETGAYAGWILPDGMSIDKFNYGRVKTHNLDGFYRVDYGYITGISYRWDWITFNARYTHGLHDVGKPGQPLGWTVVNRAYTVDNFVFKMEVPFK